MKKMIFSLVATVIGVTAMYAQSQVATLTHEGEITTFYGYKGLQNAHDAAVSGDMITLSSGNFEGITITKAINLRGAGMQTDKENNIPPTYVVGDVTLDISEEETQALTVEGVQFKETIRGRYNFLKNAVFTKCIMKKSFYNVKMQNVQFVQCKIHDLNPSNSMSTFSVINSFVRSYSSGGSNGVFKNCIVSPHGDNGSFYNCILWSEKLYASCVAENCCGSTQFASVYSTAGIYVNLFKEVAQTSNKVIAVSTLFKTYSYSSQNGAEEDWENESFELTDEAKATYLGDDDKEIGIYGGLMPFDPIPSYPRITKCNVAAKSTVDGKLSVDIEVTSVE